MMRSAMYSKNRLNSKIEKIQRRALESVSQKANLKFGIILFFEEQIQQKTFNVLMCVKDILNAAY